MRCDNCGASGPSGFWGDMYVGEPTQAQAEEKARYLWNTRGVAADAMLHACKAISDAVVEVVSKVKDGVDGIEAKRWRNARDCVRTNQRGEFVIIPGDTHRQEAVKRKFDKAMDGGEP